MGGSTSVSVLIGSSTAAAPCEKEGIGVRFGSGADASCLDTNCLDASCLEVLKGGVYKCGTPCRSSRRCPRCIACIFLQRYTILGIS
jgi:hypothetical protein